MYDIFESLEGGRLFVLTFSQRIENKTYRETIYCKFKECVYFPNTDIFKGIIVEQIVPISEFLKEDGKFHLIERTILKGNLGNIEANFNFP